MLPMTIHSTYHSPGTPPGVLANLSKGKEQIHTNSAIVYTDTTIDEYKDIEAAQLPKRSEHPAIT